MTEKTKTLSIKLPLSIFQHMDDRGRLNPGYVTQFIHRQLESPIEKKPLGELCTGYTFKVTEQLHREIKLKAMNENLPMNEYIGRMFNAYYWR